MSNCVNILINIYNLISAIAENPTTYGYIKGTAKHWQPLRYMVTNASKMNGKIINAMTY